MQKCKKCGNKLKWKQILWSSPIICKSCGTKHYVYLSSKIINWILLILISIVFNFNVFDFAGKVGSLLLNILMTIIIVAILPFLVRLYIKKEDNKIVD